MSTRTCHQANSRNHDEEALVPIELERLTLATVSHLLVSQQRHPILRHAPSDANTIPVWVGFGVLCQHCRQVLQCCHHWGFGVGLLSFNPRTQLVRFVHELLKGLNSGIFVGPVDVERRLQARAAHGLELEFLDQRFGLDRIGLRDDPHQVLHGASDEIPGVLHSPSPAQRGRIQHASEIA